MKILPFIFFILLVGKAMASSLPNCPSDENARWHNCFGTYTWNNGDKYVGEYKDDERNGQGTYTWNNGNKYVGEFKDSKRNGQGTYTYANGTIKRGYYLKGEYVPDICSGMGLTKGSEFFGQCVLKLIDKIDE